MSVARSSPRAAELIVRAATIAAGELEVTPMVEAILDLTVDSLGADVAHLCSVQEHERLRVEGTRNLPDDIVAELARSTIHHGLAAGFAAETDEIHVVRDLDRVDPSMNITRLLLERTGCRSLVAIPFTDSGRVVAVLTYASREARDIAAPELAILRTAAKIFATGLVKATTYETELRLRRHLEGVRSATLAISRRFELHEVLQCIVEEARVIADAPYAAMRVARRTDQETDAWVYSGITPEQAAALDPKSFLRVALGDTLGELYAGTPSDVHALELLAQHATVAIEHCRMHDRAAYELAERTRAEEALRVSEERYRTIVELARDGIWSTDAEHRTTFVNEAMAAMLGVTVEQMIGRPAVEFVADAPRYGEAEPHETRLRRSDGSIVAALVAATPSYDTSGRYTGATAIVADITDRNRERDALSKVHESLASAQRVARLGSFDWDVGSSEQFWSDETYRIAGRSREDFAPTFENFISVLHPDDRARVRHAVDRAIAGIEEYSLDYRILRPDGAERLVHARGDVAFGEGDRPLRMVGTIQDVTEQRRAEAAVGRLAAIIASSGDAIVAADLNGVIDEWNPGAERVFGFRAEDILGRSLQLLAPPGRDDTTALLERVRNGEMIGDYQTVRVRRDGSEVDVELTVSPVRDRSGAVVGMAIIARDISGRRRAEATLLRSEEQIRELLANAADGIFDADGEGTYIDVNEAGARMLGCTREEIIGRKIAEFVPEEDLPRLGRAIEQMRRGHPNREEWTMLRHDRTRIIVEVTGRQLEDGRFRGLTRDVTDRRRAQDALRAAEERLRTTIEDAPIGMAIVALDGRFVRVNRALCEMVRYSAEDLQRLRFQDITHPEDLASDYELLQNLMRGEISRYQMPKRYMRQDRSIVEVILHASLVRDERGEPLHLIAEIVDVTEQRRSQQERERLVAALEHERAWLRAVIDRSPVGIVLFEGRDRPRVRANHRAEELFGGALRTNVALSTPGGRALSPLETPAARALRGEPVVREELTIVDRNTPVVVSATPIRDGTSDLLGAVLVVEDVSAQKELERLREEWISVIAHDLRQPVASISAHAQILMRRAGEGPMRVGAEHVVASARRLDRMIGDLLDFSRLEAHRLEVRPRAVALDALVREIIERMAVQRRVQVRTFGALPAVVTDAARFEQVLENLVSNALKYGDKTADVVVELVTIEGAVQVSVLNQGAGIPRAELPLLFERFRRTRGARGSGIDGVGLGLYITRGLVEANGGRIWAESEPGAVTAFRFTQPIALPRFDRESVH